MNSFYLRYCKYYKGEGFCPSSYSEAEAKIWRAEEWVFQEYDFKEEDKELEFYEMVLAYISKWAPYDYVDIWEVYSKRLPNKYKHLTEF